jgi:hypothetical protein
MQGTPLSAEKHAPPRNLDFPIIKIFFGFLQMALLIRSASHDFCASQCMPGLQKKKNGIWIS